ncbi:hypothetical protein [Nitrospira japonica]|uniref:hypothetical protein n=1 Tax=Nitrospira japonica TaxID=1325564 RepID=UPI0009BBEA84|nr:hypothetical protein [Nitrospira japonica]
MVAVYLPVRFLTRSLVLVALFALSAGCSPVQPVSVEVMRVPETPCTDNQAIIFCDGFESGTLGLWQDGVDSSRQKVTAVDSDVVSGRRSLEVVYPAGDDGGWMTRWFMPGHDHVFARIYVRFQPGWRCGGNCTKLIAFYANRVDDRWSGFGKAGIRPTGQDYFYAGLATSNWHRQPDPGEIIFYSYHPEMRQAKDGRFWGNFSYQDDPRDALRPGRWYCVEFEVQANSPGQHDGYQNMWIDGMLRGRVSGMRWRDSPDVRINAFQLTFSGAVPVTERMWMDDVVVSTERVGCNRPLVNDTADQAATAPR